MERTEKARQEADAALLILDGSEALTDTDRELILGFGGNGAVVINKTDLPQTVTEETVRALKPEYRQELQLQLMGAQMPLPVPR